MAYGEQKLSTGRITSIAVVGLLHVALGYAFVTGLAYQVIKKAPTILETFDVVEEQPPEQEPPPPPPEPDTAPPPPIDTPPPIVAPVVAAPPPMVLPPSPPAPPPVITAPPPPPVVAPPPQPVAASPRGNPSTWVTNDDYPSDALRREEQGVTAYRLEIGTDGRVTGCSVTTSSGSQSLDDAACRYLTRRARFNPAKDGSGNPTNAVYSGRVRWQMPE